MNTQEKLKAIARLKDPSGFALETLANSIQVMKGDKGEKGDTGETGAQGKDGARGPIGPKGDVGTKGDAGPMGLAGANGHDATVDLNAIVEEAVKALLDSKPWKDTQKNILYNKFDQRWHGGGSGSVLIADLTSQCNGVTKIFTVPSNSRSIKLESTQFPIIYRPLVDFIVSGVSLTLQAGVGAPETGQTLLFYYVA